MSEICWNCTYIQNEIGRLQARIQSLQSTNEGLRNERDATQSKLNQLQKENNKLQIDNAQLMEEQKELEMRNQNLVEENKRLKVKCIDTTRYLEWNDEEIVNWIVSLEDGRFNEYEQKLRQIFATEELKGEYLSMITENNLKDWGLVNFGKRKALFKAIQDLTSQNIENQQVLEGNNIAPTAYL